MPRAVAHGGRRIGLSLVVGLGLLAAGCTSFERPRVESVTITPSTLDTRSRATAEVVTNDAEARSATIEYEWLRNGERIPGAIEATLDLSVPGHGDRGDTIAVRVVASRRFASSGSRTSSEIRVEPLATVVMQQSTEYYSVEGTDSESVFASIRKNELNEGTSSRVRLGQTRFSLTKAWQTVQLDAGCALDVIELRETPVITLPGQPPTVLPTDVQARLDRFRAAVSAHEDRHVVIRKQHLDAIAAALRTAPPAADCPALDDQVNTTIESMLRVERADQRKFDDEDEVRVRTTCAPIEAERSSLRATLTALRNQPARYNALLPAYNALVEDYNWCLAS